MKRVFFHVHIWKTGGTSFFNICSENFGKAFHRDIMLIQNWFLSKQQLEWLLEYHEWIRCYSCHMLSGDLPYNHKDVEVVGLAFVRNPVNRFVSSYNFQRSENYRGGIAKDHSFDSFYKKALVEEDNPMWRNGQTFQLGGLGNDTGLNAVVRRVEKGQLILLPTERFDECCVLLERLFPEDFKDCSYTRYNVSKRSTTISEKQKADVAEYMDIDMKLLDIANEYLEKKLDQQFDNRDERNRYNENFQDRCKRKKNRKRLTAVLRRVKQKIDMTFD